MANFDTQLSNYLKTGSVDGMGQQPETDLENAFRRDRGISSVAKKPPIIPKSPEMPPKPLKKALGENGRQSHKSSISKRSGVKLKPNAATSNAKPKPPLNYGGTRIIELRRSDVLFPSRPPAKPKNESKPKSFEKPVTDSRKLKQVPSEKKMMQAIDLMEQCAAGDKAALNKRKEILARTK